MDMPLLHHNRIAAAGESPDRWMFFLHGIYGAGRNWGSVARAFVRAQPSWGVVLVDLRHHGQTPPLPGPNTLESCARDLVRLAEATETDVRGVLGHSFGGKVALLYAAISASIADDPPDQVWVVDSTPDARPPSGSAWEMLRVLRESPGPFPDREAVLQAVERAGFARPVAQWMSTNAVPRDGLLHWRIDADPMEELLRDFFRTDAWSVVERPPNGSVVHLIKATESDLLTAEAMARVRRAAHATGRVHLHEIQGGHWLNADNPTALVALLAEQG
jgi:pimeloyl-ACP methyl ester carboxylesterase